MSSDVNIEGSPKDLLAQLAPTQFRDWADYWNRKLGELEFGILQKGRESNGVVPTKD